ncbi:MAG: hypothetical protein V3T24_08680 [Longimicrobiales bacterium]
MYRAPATSSGASGFLMLILLLWGALYISGCTDSPSGLGFDEMEPIEDVEIEMATDPDLTTALIEDVSASMSANMTTEAAAEISTADSLFNQARVELTRGDYDRVRSLGDRARDALGRALAKGRDRSSLDDFIDRVRDVRRLLDAGDTAECDRPTDVASDIARLSDQATDARDRGDYVTAGKRAIDAHRLTDRSRARCHDIDPEKHARLVVGMADQAVQLANRLLEGTVISERKQHLLDTAARLAAASADAYQNGHFRRAIIFGHKAVSVSLMAVIRPDRVTDDRIRALTDVANSEFQVLIDLAEAQLEAARIALEEEPNEFFEKLLKRAVAAFETGVEHVENGHPRGIQLIWRAAVVGAMIAG